MMQRVPLDPLIQKFLEKDGLSIHVPCQSKADMLTFATIHSSQLELLQLIQATWSPVPSPLVLSDLQTHPWILRPQSPCDMPKHAHPTDVGCTHSCSFWQPQSGKGPTSPPLQLTGNLLQMPSQPCPL